ncbi:MAG: DUF4185 domain-containing protein [Kosmotogaceae bacterium]
MRIIIMLLICFITISTFVFSTLEDVEELELIGKLTGPDAINNTFKYDVYGTDLGHTFNDGEITFFVFGDTFGINKSNWRKNVMAFTKDQDPSDGIHFDGFITKNPHSSYSITDGKLNIYVDKGSDLWTGVDLAPKFLKVPSNDNWVIETCITNNDAEEYGTNFAGLLIFNDSFNWWLWGQLGNKLMETSGIIDGEFVKIAGMEYSYPYLRIEKKDNLYVFKYSSDGVDWSKAGEFEDSTQSLSNASIGIGAKEWGEKAYYIEIDYLSINDDTYSFDSQRFQNDFDWISPDADDAPAKELISETKGNVTAIPTNGVSINGNYYLHFMMVKKWGDPGKWDTSFSGLAVSTNGGYNWKKLDTVTWSSDSNFAQVGIAKASQWDEIPKNSGVSENDILFWGIPSGRFGGAKLMKVNKDEIENLAAFLYFSGLDKDGDPVWSKEESEAVEIIVPPVGECSAIYNHYLEKWIFTYLNEESHDLEIRESDYPWGPWSEPIQLVSSREYSGLYGAYMNPLFVENEGEYIYFTMSLWVPYNVYLMKVRLVK